MADNTSNIAVLRELEVVTRECTFLDDPLRSGQNNILYASQSEPTDFERGNSKFLELQKYIVFTIQNNSSSAVTVKEFLLQDAEGGDIPFLEVPQFARGLNRGDTLNLAFRKEKLSYILREIYRRESPLKCKPVFRCREDADSGGHSSREFTLLGISGPATPIQDPELIYHADVFRARTQRILNKEHEITCQAKNLVEFADCYREYDLQCRDGQSWTFTEWAPNAKKIYLLGEFSQWKESEGYALSRLTGPGVADGTWQITLPRKLLRHGDYYKLMVHWEGGKGERIPACARWVVQDPNYKTWTARVWAPDEAYQFQFQYDKNRQRPEFPTIYEAHVGIATEQEKVGSFNEFRTQILPRIKAGGYNTVQLMGILEHPLYASFGYQISSFFAVSSRFGTPDEFKALVDEAHRMGLAVIIDLIHSHTVKNHIEGLSCFDGTEYQYFHAGQRGSHLKWDSRCFDYEKQQVVRFLLSNCRYWLEEFHIDGFRFDAVTSMLFKNHGIDTEFTRIDQYFPDHHGYNPVDEDAAVYLGLANKLIHEINPAAFTIAEDASGFPGLTSPIEAGGIGFDYRFAMGVTDYWLKAVKLAPEHWDIGKMWYELTRRRSYERTISYAECHDQSFVGDKPLSFSMMDDAMYYHMGTFDPNHRVRQGVALHKMIRLVTLATAEYGYLNFIGNEFGHPEWIDLPRDENRQSYKYARRQWSLRDNSNLKYFGLAEFDREMLRVFQENLTDKMASLRLNLNHNEKKLLAFERGNLLFVFNFHPNNSYFDQPIPASPGSYDRILNSDHPMFSGHGILSEDVGKDHHTYKIPPDGRYELKVYIPCLTGIVLKKRPPTNFT
jgi:1,4-alpha-glucan branching enzyme